MSQNFRTVLRGYEPAQVDAEISALSTELENARAELGALHAQLADARRGQTVLEQRVTAAEARLAEAARASEAVVAPTYAGLGERIGEMLTLAEEEAKEMHRSAKQEAQRLVDLARERASQTAAKADRYGGRDPNRRGRRCRSHAGQRAAPGGRVDGSCR